IPATAARNCTGCSTAITRTLSTIVAVVCLLLLSAVRKERLTAATPSSTASRVRATGSLAGWLLSKETGSGITSTACKPTGSGISSTLFGHETTSFPVLVGSGFAGITGFRSAISDLPRNISLLRIGWMVRLGKRYICEGGKSCPLQNRRSTCELVFFKNLVCGLREFWAGVHERRIHQVFAQKPSLKFVRTKNVADHHIIGAIVAQFISALGDLAALANDCLVSIQQTGNLYWNLFPSLWRAFNLSSFGHIMGHSDCQAAEKLNALRNRVNDLYLLGKVLIEKQVQLVKSWPGDLPVRLFIQIAKCHRVREQLVKLLSHFKTHRLFQLKMKCVGDSAETLKLGCALMNSGFRRDPGVISRGSLFGHY